LTATRTDIANQSLRLLGDFHLIPEDSSTDDYKGTVALAEAFDRVLNSTLRKYPWKFARRFVDLVLLKENPSSDWLYSYLHPDYNADCLSIRGLAYGTDYDNRAERGYNRVDYLECSRASGDTQAVGSYTAAAECVITLTAHGFEDGDLVTITWYDEDGESPLPATDYIVSDATTDTFKIKDTAAGAYVDSTAWTYANGGTAGPAAHRYILTNAYEARAEITALIADLSLFPQDFLDYLAAELAYDTGPVVVGMERWLAEVRNNIKYELDHRRETARANGVFEEPEPRMELPRSIQARRPR
jgi:hypothetical protein